MKRFDVEAGLRSRIIRLRVAMERCAEGRENALADALQRDAEIERNQETLSKRTLFRAGDSVHHVPSGEDWILACDEEQYMGNTDVRPMGWPETIARGSDCTLLEAATDSQRLDMLRRVAAMNTDGKHDGRKSRAAAQLEAETRGVQAVEVGSAVGG